MMCLNIFPFSQSINVKEGYILMAKIKFNLNFGGEQIRTLDDLRDNFSIEDVLDVYNNGLLVKLLDFGETLYELMPVLLSESICFCR